MRVMHTTPSQQQQWPTHAAPRRPKRRRVWLWMVVAIVAGLAGLVVVAVLTGGRPTPAPSAGAQQPSSAAPSFASGVPSPDAGQRAVYLEALAAIDPGLVTKEDRAVSRGRDTCLDVGEGKGPARVAANVRVRFSGGDVRVSLAEARRIVAAVKVWCPAK